MLKRYEHIIPKINAPAIDPIVPIAEIEPDSPLLTWLKEKTRYGFFLDRKPISVAHVSAVEADKEPI